MHLADLHLGVLFSYLGAKAEERSRDLESAFFRALELAVDKNIHAVVIAGDLFDTFNPPTEIVSRVKAAFAKVSGFGIPIILIPGTHDSHRYARCVYARESFPGTDIVTEPGKPMEKSLNGQTVSFYGYSGAGRNQAAPSFRRSDGDGLHLALVHGSVAEGAHWTPSPRDFALSPKDIEDSGFHYVALGHHHNFRQMRYGATVAVYPGTLEGLKFGEDGDRHLVIAEVDKNGAAIERIRHNRRTVSEIAIDLGRSGIRSADELTRAIAKYADSDTVARIVLSGTADFSLGREVIEAELAERFFHLEIIDETSLCDSEMVRSVVNENTIRGLFVRKLLKEIEESPAEDRPVAELALRLGLQQLMQELAESGK